MYSGYADQEADLKLRLEKARSRANSGAIQARPPGAGPPDESEEDVLQAIDHLESRLEDEALQRFFADRMAYVALSGRVPVKVSTQFGDIQIGDALTSSPIPGVAMKATQAKV